MNNPQEQNSSMQQGSSSVQQKAQDTANKVTDQLRDTTGNVADKALDTARTTAETQKGRVAEGFGTVADALRQTGHNLDDQDQGSMAHFAHMAADRLDQFSNDLQNKSVDEMIGDVEDFARRDPQLFLGGALVLGLLASRFFKSSARRPQRRQFQANYGGQYGYGQSGSYQGSRGSQYRSRYPTTEGYSGSDAGRSFDEADLADYRRDVVDNQYTGTPAQSGYDRGTSTQSGYSSGTTRQSGYGTGMGETSGSSYGTSSNAGTGTGATGQDFDKPPMRKPGEQLPPSTPNRTDE